jgi:hypothetical protein
MLNKQFSPILRTTKTWGGCQDIIVNIGTCSSYVTLHLYYSLHIKFYSCCSMKHSLCEKRISISYIRDIRTTCTYIHNYVLTPTSSFSGPQYRWKLLVKVISCYMMVLRVCSLKIQSTNKKQWYLSKMTIHG